MISDGTLILPCTETGLDLRSRSIASRSGLPGGGDLLVDRADRRQEPAALRLLEGDAVGRGLPRRAAQEPGEAVGLGRGVEPGAAGAEEDPGPHLLEHALRRTGAGRLGEEGVGQVVPGDRGHDGVDAGIARGGHQARWRRRRSRRAMPTRGSPAASSSTSGFSASQSMSCLTSLTS